MRGRGRNNSRIIVALDVPNVARALNLVELLGPHVAGFKVGLELLMRMIADIGSSMSDEVAHSCADLQRDLWNRLRESVLMIDGKFSDIPNTVGSATREVERLEPDFITVHASAGSKAMQAAVSESLDAKILAVTVLTSLDMECETIFGAPAIRKVECFADMAAQSEVPGIVCSGAEVTLLHNLRPDITYVIPGVRSSGAKTQDQARVVTPAEAIRSGADYVVIGREITGEEDPVKAAQRINADIATAIAEMGEAV